jgi:DNA-binding MarR family transcriptional regulator
VPNVRFEKLLTQPTRLTLMAFLCSRRNGSAGFVEVCSHLDIQRSGALSVHARVLEGAGYIEQQKSFVGRRPQTLLVITSKGREAFARHAAAFVAMAGAFRQSSNEPDTTSKGAAGIGVVDVAS